MESQESPLPFICWKRKEPQTVWSRNVRTAFDTGMDGELARGLGFIQIRALFPQSFPRSRVSTGISCGIRPASDYSLSFPLHVTQMGNWELVKQCCSFRRAVGWQQSCSCPGTIPGAVSGGIAPAWDGSAPDASQTLGTGGSPSPQQRLVVFDFCWEEKNEWCEAFWAAGAAELLDVLEARELFGNTLQWTPWCGYGIVHFGGAKVSFPEVSACHGCLSIANQHRGSC